MKEALLDYRQDQQQRKDKMRYPIVNTSHQVDTHGVKLENCRFVSDDHKKASIPHVNGRTYMMDNQRSLQSNEIPRPDLEYTINQSIKRGCLDMFRVWDGSNNKPPNANVYATPSGKIRAKDSFYRSSYNPFDPMDIQRPFFGNCTRLIRKNPQLNDFRITKTYSQDQSVSNYNQAQYTSGSVASGPDIMDDLFQLGKMSTFGEHPLFHGSNVFSYDCKISGSAEKK